MLDPTIAETFKRADASLDGQWRNVEVARNRHPSENLIDKYSEEWAYQILRAQLSIVLKPLGYEPKL